MTIKRMVSGVCLAMVLTVICGMNTTAINGQEKGLAAAIAPFVDSGQVPGAVMLVGSFDGNIIAFETKGFADVEAKKPLEKDSVFWIASMSKVITAAAFMMLVDEGKISPDDPIEKIFPEFKNLKVAQKQEDGTVLLIPVKTKPTFRQALSHTAGFPFITPIMNRYGIDCLSGDKLAFTTSQFPSQYQPMTKYSYSNLGIDLAGAAVEKISGQPLEEFMKSRLFGPLEMKDTTFFPNESQRNRFAKSYRFDKQTKSLQAIKVNQLGDLTKARPFRFEEGGGGLFGTAIDYYHFLMMLANKGVYQGKRILSEKAVAEMTKNQTGSLGSYGFGLNISGNSYGHGGAFATYGSVRIDKKVIFVYMTQISNVPAHGQSRQALDKAVDQILNK